MTESTQHSIPPFGTALRYVRETRNIGLRELARRSGVSPGLLSRIETGARTAPPLESVLRLATALGLQQGSFDFQNLLRSWHNTRDPYNERLPDYTNELHRLAQLLAGVPMPPKVSTTVVACGGVAELAADVVHDLFQRADELASVTIQFEDGTTKRIQLTKKESDSKDE